MISVPWLLQINCDVEYSNILHNYPIYANVTVRPGPLPIDAGAAVHIYTNFSGMLKFDDGWRISAKIYNQHNERKNW